MYNCMSTFLHYVHCKDALLDCSAPCGERCKSLTWVDEIVTFLSSKIVKYQLPWVTRLCRHAHHVTLDFYNAQALKYIKANILRLITVSIWYQYVQSMYVLIYHINYNCSFAKLNVDHLFSDKFQSNSDHHVLMSFEIMSKLWER